MIIITKNFWRRNKNKIYSSGCLGITAAGVIIHASGKCDNLQCHIAANTTDKPAEIFGYKDSQAPQRLEIAAVSGTANDYPQLRRF